MKKYFTVFITSTVVMSFAFLALAKENSPQMSNSQSLDGPSFEKMTQLSNPNETQLILSALLGEWNYSVKVWEKPSSEPAESTGTSINEMVMGDRFLSMKVSGILNVGGNFMPFEANGLIGHDNVRKVFTSVWVDTLNPGMMNGSGTFDKKSNVIKESGNFTSALDEAVHSYRSDIQIIDTESYKRLIFLKDKSGKEYKMMEFTYSKKK